ncbi:GNAT family N-acetyltransferase [Polycladidibacter stylochi]|uniref:GNAT family N-acetyltransferase n=1 Tax=Polycladidibacter stylochi TaxID=1807766 RepID=UPI00082F337B|nr:GNAT family N-acetyltransferase [Pseudovibrio stylochi]
MVIEYEEIPEESSCSADGLPQDTARLRLDAARKDDLADILYLANNRKIAEALSNMPHPFLLEDAKAIVKRSQNPMAHQSVFAARMKNTGRFIGAVGFAPSIDEPGMVQLGYWLGEPFWGQGYATEAAQSAVDFAFMHCEHEEILATCRLTNPASKRVLEKTGFQQIGQALGHSSALKSHVAVERFILKKSTWKALRRWGARDDGKLVISQYAS